MGDGLDDRRLVERARLGDVDAYEQLVRVYQGIAFRVAMAITRDAGVAEDVIQEAFVKAFYALDGFDPSSPFQPWLLRIVTNEALNRQRAEQRRIARRERAAAQEQTAWQHTSDADPETGAIEAERREFVLSTLECLSEPDRLILTYRYLLDLSVSEIAELLDIPQRTVRSRISRALNRLRDAVLDKTEYDVDHPPSGGRR